MATREGSFSVEDMKNVQINIGAVVKEADEWDQEMGACPKPGVATLRKWDQVLANRYRIMHTLYLWAMRSYRQQARSLRY